MAKEKAIGFGFLPSETKHHFLVRIPRSKDEKIRVFERFNWDEEDTQTTDIEDSQLKVELDAQKWQAIKPILEKELNRKLKNLKMPAGKFKMGDNPVERLYGKEMVLLMWGIDRSDPGLIPVAIQNWLGLSAEERWWLFTMANAATGHHSQGSRGWRMAIRYGLTDNPVDDKVQGSIMEHLYRNNIGGGNI